MKPHVRVGAAAVGAGAVVGIGLLGCSWEVRAAGSATIVPPATVSIGDVTTTTLTVASFHPTVNATPPPPPSH